jgi:hypothetical protein
MSEDDVMRIGVIVEELAKLEKKSIDQELSSLKRPNIGGHLGRRW